MLWSLKDDEIPRFGVKLDMAEPKDNKKDKVDKKDIELHEKRTASRGVIVRDHDSRIIGEVSIL